jgi:hypothetical protein
LILRLIFGDGQMSRTIFACAGQRNSSRGGAFSVQMEARMGLAEYMIVAKGDGWTVLHDGAANNDYASKEAAFESAVAAASLALREGHEVHVSVPARDAGNRTTLGVKE